MYCDSCILPFSHFFYLSCQTFSNKNVGIKHNILLNIFLFFLCTVKPLYKKRLRFSNMHLVYRSFQSNSLIITLQLSLSMTFLQLVAICLLRFYILTIYYEFFLFLLFFLCKTEKRLYKNYTVLLFGSLINIA